MVCVLNFFKFCVVWLVLNKNFIGPTGTPCRQVIDKQWFISMDLIFHLEQSSWIIELEQALEKFSIRTYLDWFDQHHFIDEVMDGKFPEKFLNYLKSKVSNPCS